MNQLVTKKRLQAGPNYNQYALLVPESRDRIRRPRRGSARIGSAHTHPAHPAQPPRRGSYREGWRKWVKFAKHAKLSNSDDFHDIYHYSRLRSAFPWATSFRAGVVVLADAPSGSRDLLVVKQRGGSIMYNGTRRVLPSYTGLPKGSADPQDISAFHTATRELHEETGIDLNVCGALTRTTFLISREEVHEIAIYFVIICPTRPEVFICGDEIIGASWICAESLREVGEISIPTAMLFGALREIDMRESITNFITPRM